MNNASLFIVIYFKSLQKTLINICIISVVTCNLLEFIFAFWYGHDAVSLNIICALWFRVDNQLNSYRLKLNIEHCLCNSWFKCVAPVDNRYACNNIIIIDGNRYILHTNNCESGQRKRKTVQDRRLRTWCQSG
jgi:hypothetical protein